MWKHIPLSFEAFASQNEHILQGVENTLVAEGDWNHAITPRREQLLSGYFLVSLDPYDLFPNSLKVVMIFQDVYPKPGDACGVATACLGGHIPETLKNIYDRLDQTYPPWREKWPDGPYDGDIRGWATQGVLLTNMSLTTRKGQTKSHMNNWSLYTERFIKWLSSTFPYLVFILFGKEAHIAKRYIDSKHAILTTSHPSNMGKVYGFDRCNIFNEANAMLKANGRRPIQWEDIEYV